MVDVILHLGLHKTATGTLQRQFFPACQDLKLFTTAVPKMLELMRLVTRKDPLYFDTDRARELIFPVLSSEKPNVLSNESFSGPPYSGFIECGLDHRSAVLANLRNVFPEAKAILVLRRQDTLARSLYRQYLKSGGTRKVRRLYGLEGNERPPLISLDRFLFTPYVDAVKAAFPAGVLFLTFEEFVNYRVEFLRKITDFIGVEFPNVKLRKENASSLGPIGFEFSRLINHLFRTLLNPGGLLPGIPMYKNNKISFSSPLEILHDKWPGRSSKRGNSWKVGQEILDMVRSDNKQLDAQYKLGIDKFGYY